MPNKLLTRAEFRDVIRRKLAIVPPVDIDPSALPGQQPTNAPYPTNQQINDALGDFVSDVNRATGFHVTELSFPVNPLSSSTYGPGKYYLGDFTPNAAGSTTLLDPKGLVNDVQRALWIPSSSGVPILLYPVERDNLDRSNNTNYYATPPSLPNQWWIEGYVLNITPAPSESGVINLICGTGVFGFACDSSVLDQVPIDYQVIFEDGAIYRLSITQTMDVEAQTRAQAFGPLAQQGIAQFKRWKLGGTGAPVPQVLFKSYRTGYGTRRVVR